MAAKKNKAEVQSSAKVEQKFSKVQILASAQYANRRDLVYALLDDNKEYTKAEVAKIISDFMKEKKG